MRSRSSDLGFEQSLESERDMDRESPQTTQEEGTAASVELPATPSIASRRKRVVIVVGVLIVASLILVWVLVRSRANPANTPRSTDKTAQTAHTGFR